MNNNPPVPLPGFTNEVLNNALGIICAAASDAMQIASTQSGQAKDKATFCVIYGGVNMTVTVALDQPDEPEATA